jgi:putative ABC transport system permease protein
MPTVLIDIWRSLRSLRRAPGFAALAVAMLAVGIGANTAMFSVVSAVWLRPLPYATPDRLVSIEEAVPRLAAISPTLPVNAHDVLEWRKNSVSFDAFALVAGGGAKLSIGGEPVRVSAGVVSANFFGILGVHPLWGRVFAEGDDQPGRDRVVILSFALWTRAFGGDPGVIGRRVMIDDAPSEIVGVLPAGVRVPRQGQLQKMAFNDAEADLWRPFVVRDSDLVTMSEFDYGCLARMKRGVTIAAAQADLDSIERAIAQSAGADGQLHAIVSPLADQAAARSRDGVLMLVTAVGAVLMIVCVNLSNVLLARASGRRRELAIRAALGAGTRDLVRLVLAESLALTILGAAFGIAIAAWALRTVLVAAPLGLPMLRELRLDPVVWLFVGGLVVATAIVIGFLPAWQNARTDPQEALRSIDRSATESRRGGAARRLLIGVEVALCASCLVLAGLLLGSFVRLMHVDKGFDAEHAVVVPLVLSGPRAQNETTALALLRDVLARVQALPGVAAVGVTNKLPVTGEGSNLGLYAESNSVTTDEHPIADYRCVTGDYFNAMGIAVVAGRPMRDADGDHRVGMISVGTAARLWPHENPIGRHFRLGGPDAPPVEIIGMVSDVHVSLQKAPNLTVYVPIWQTFRSNIAMAVRTTADPSSIVAAVRDVIREALPDLPAPGILSADDLVTNSVATRRFQLDLVMLFAGVALLLAAMGVYAVVAQSVMRRTREIGIRIAFGAAHVDVWRLIAREGLMPVGAGLVAGLLVAALATPLVRSLLFGLTPFDLPTYAAVASVMLLSAAAACAIPARRAVRIDPLLALSER